MTVRSGPAAPVAALFLDFDGLVSDTERAARQAWVDLYTRLSLGFPPELWPTMAGNSGGAALALADLAGRLGRAVSDEEWQWERARKSALADREPLRPGVLGLLEQAARRALPVAIVSSSTAGWVVAHLDRLGIAERIAVVVTREDAAVHKPAPDLYQVALRRLAVPPAAGLAFEDSPVGVRAAKAAGLYCVAVPGSTALPGDTGPADRVLASLEGFELPAKVPAGPAVGVR